MGKIRPQSTHHSDAEFIRQELFIPYRAVGFLKLLFQKPGAFGYPPFRQSFHFHEFFGNSHNRGIFVVMADGKEGEIA
ncbi:MAG: hypothetical protein KHY39_03050 [Clostridiaceae bacterium]|nr:hypothetical protein [Clostridiaceae bacterium]